MEVPVLVPTPKIDLLGPITSNSIVSVDLAVRRDAPVSIPNRLVRDNPEVDDDDGMTPGQ